MSMELPKHLFLAAAMRCTSIQPEQVRYLTDNRDLAIEYGLSKAVCSGWKVLRFSVIDARIVIDLAIDSRPLTHSMLCKITLNLHDIIPQRMDNWTPMYEHNNKTHIPDGWRTDKVVRSILSVRPVSMYDWLVGRTVVINHPRF